MVDLSCLSKKELKYSIKLLKQYKKLGAPVGYENCYIELGYNAGIIDKIFLYNKNCDDILLLNSDNKLEIFYCFNESKKYGFYDDLIHKLSKEYMYTQKNSFESWQIADLKRFFYKIKEFNNTKLLLNLLNAIENYI